MSSENKLAELKTICATSIFGLTHADIVIIKLTDTYFISFSGWKEPDTNDQLMARFSKLFILNHYNTNFIKTILKNTQSG